MSLMMMTAASRIVSGDAPPAAVIAISLSSPTGVVVQGNTLARTVTLARTSYTGTVTLAASSLPTGVTAAFSNPTLSGGTLTSVLTLTAAADAPTITSDTVTITATGSGVDPATATLTLTVSEPSALNLVAFDTPEKAFLLGPQTTPASDTETPAFANMTANMLSDALARGPLFPAFLPYRDVAGTVTFTNGSGAVSGTGTNFVADGVTPWRIQFAWLPPEIDPLGQGAWVWVQANGTAIGATSFALNTSGGWPYPTLTTTMRTEEVPDGSFDSFGGHMQYYDWTFGAYQIAHKHDNATLMAYADASALAWWNFPQTQNARRLGNEYGSDFKAAPRMEALGGLMAWALRGCAGSSVDPDDVWEYCRQCAFGHNENWIVARTSLGSYPRLANDVRDTSYTMQYLTWLGRLHPNAGVRASATEKAVAALTDLFLPRQSPNGLWEAYNGIYWKKYDASNPTLNQDVPAAQNLLTGLLHHAMIDLRELLVNDPTLATTYAAAIADLEASFLLSCDGWMLGYAGPPNHALLEANGVAIRGPTYAMGEHLAYLYPCGSGTQAQRPRYGEVVGHGTDGVLRNHACEPTGIGNYRWYGPTESAEFQVLYDGASLSDVIKGARFLNATTAATFYYAAWIAPTEAERDKFLGYGDELYSSMWGLEDGQHSQYDTAFPKNKDRSEHTRSNNKGQPWRRLAIAKTF